MFKSIALVFATLLVCNYAATVMIPQGTYMGTIKDCDNSTATPSQYGLEFTSKDLINSINGDLPLSPITNQLYTAYDNNTMQIGVLGCVYYTLNGQSLKVYFNSEITFDCTKASKTCDANSDTFLADLQLNTTSTTTNPSTTTGASSTTYPFVALIAILSIISMLF